MITNYLSPVSFLVTIDRIPNVEFFTQKATIPSLTMTPILQTAPIHNIYKEPDRLDYTELDLSFIVDENMTNYKEILNWMEGLGTPVESDQYANLAKTKEGIVSDISILIQNSARNPNIKFTFTDCFPTSLAPVMLDVTSPDVFYPECNVTFRYNNFFMETIS